MAMWIIFLGILMHCSFLEVLTQLPAQPENCSEQTQKISFSHSYKINAPESFQFKVEPDPGPLRDNNHMLFTNGEVDGDEEQNIIFRHNIQLQTPKRDCEVLGQVKALLERLENLELEVVHLKRICNPQTCCGRGQGPQQAPSELALEAPAVACERFQELPPSGAAEQTGLSEMSKEHPPTELPKSGRTTQKPAYLRDYDFPILHLDGIVDEHSNVLGFSMFNTSHPFYMEFVRSLNMSWRENCELNPYPGPALSAALMFDAVHVVVSAVRELNRSQEIGVKPLACTSANIWQHGTSLMNYLRMVEYDGLTGHVEFNSKGQRTNYTLRILEKGRHGHREIGVWYSNKTLAMNATTLDINASESLANKTLVITTILENPYMMRRANFQELSGPAQYEGFCVDMLHELADILKFRFQIKLVDDGLYGAPEPNGSWTGMVGELINRKADLAVAAFTITAEREKVIDFSKPFMTLGISILYRVHMGRKPGYFSFLDPFSPAVWLFMLLAYLAVSCVLFLAARLSPYEWYNPHPCLRERHNILENQYTLGNSLWFPVGGFMQQGSEIMPRAL
ncbi:PREDICTED: glutamate receptor ionotropic, kainate 5-like, partial [Thamnophis sirtalis]|uniref:Glutamate receptor ionotropic, kainate 5-like n=1 Tax=Thamnophis sirtalis TaxID=35019 RepID=A0A6I9YKC5_9SAUR